MQTISIIVSGRVQGVFYRQSTKEKARELGVTGTVSNKPDGSVQIIATGTAEQLQALEAWCKIGPPRAVVDSMETAILDTQVFSGFTIQR